MRWGLVLLMTTLFFSACSDGEGSLEGSLGSVYRLEFDAVRVRLYSSELAIEYARNDGAVPLRVTLQASALPESGGGEWELGDLGDVTGQLRDGTYVPRFSSGVLNLENFTPREGASIQGDFDAAFSPGRDRLGVHGTFSTRLVLVTAPATPVDD